MPQKLDYIDVELYYLVIEFQHIKNKLLYTRGDSAENSFPIFLTEKTDNLENGFFSILATIIDLL